MNGLLKGDALVPNNRLKLAARGRSVAAWSHSARRSLAGALGGATGAHELSTRCRLWGWP